MTINIWYGFSKRKNSTKQPTGDGQTVSAVLKENTSFMNPVFYLEYDADTVRPGFNYVYAFSRYYFVNDFTYISNSIFEVSCEIDVLATYRDAISASTFYVERAEVDCNEYIPDGMYSALTYPPDWTKTESDNISGFSLSGVYFLRVTGSSYTDSDTGVTTYACSLENLREIFDFMFNEDNFADVITDALVKSFFNPFQYILSLTWYPFELSTYGGDEESVKLGWWDTGIYATVVQTNGYYFAMDVSTPDAPYDDFRRYSRAFANARAYIPSIGVVDIDPQFYANDTLRFLYMVDWLTGQSTVTVYAGANSTDLLAQFTGTIGVPIQISQNSNNFLTGATQIGTGIFSALATGGINAISGISSAVNGVQSMLQPTPSVNGTVGNKMLIRYMSKIILCWQFARSTDGAPNTVGRPLCEERQISDLTGGYIKCAGASIQNRAYGQEKEMINSYLNGGFFHE